MKILVACEESQAVCKAFRARGHEAYSADTRCQGKRRGKVASKTPQGLANAMAEQWGCLHD